MAKRVATIRGTAIVPGVSLNRRLYTKELIGKLVNRAQARIADGKMPLTMLTHHAAEDDSSRIVGRITKLRQAEDGSAKFEADIADTSHGRDIAALVTGDDPFLDGVSIRGWWLGDVRDVDHDGETVQTGDDLELDGLDFTKNPGVQGARIEAADRAMESAGLALGRVLVCESVASATAEKSKTPYGDVQYADPGYQSDGVKRYPLDTKAHVKAAWSYVNQADNAKAYSANQLKRIKGRIKAAAKKFGVTISSDAEAFVPTTQIGETRMGQPVALSAEQVAECWGDMAPDGGFCIDAHNGPVMITLRVCGLDPADLPEVGQAAMDAAVQALKCLDPDLDADIDVPGADAEDTDGDMGETQPVVQQRRVVESPSADQIADAVAARLAANRPTTEPAAESTPQVPSKTPEPEQARETVTPAPEPAADHTHKEEPAMADTTPAVEPTPAATTETSPAPAAGSVTLSGDQFAQLLAALKPVAPVAPAAESAPAPAVVETPAPAAPAEPVETEEQRIARIVDQRMAEERTKLIQDLVESGQGPTRKGLVQPTTEAGQPVQAGLNEHGLPSDWPNKPLHQYTSEEFKRYAATEMERHILGNRAGH